jgi:arginyl-tRNA synthetase
MKSASCQRIRAVQMKLNYKERKKKLIIQMVRFMKNSEPNKTRTRGFRGQNWKAKQSDCLVG